MSGFDEAWAKKEAEGYRYGRDALENVRFGWELAMRSLGIHDDDPPRKNETAMDVDELAFEIVQLYYPEVTRSYVGRRLKIVKAAIASVQEICAQVAVEAQELHNRCFADATDDNGRDRCAARSRTAGYIANDIRALGKPA